MVRGATSVGLAIAITFAAAGLALGSSAKAKPTWAITQVKGNHYKVKFTNNTGQTVNAFAIADASKTANPVTSMTVAGFTCQAYAAYGSFYCTGGSVAPAVTAAIILATQTALATGVGWQMCSSPDDEQTNDCKDVASLGSLVQSAINDLATALRDEERALTNEHNPKAPKDDIAPSLTSLDGALDALPSGPGLSGARTAIREAKAFDEGALSHWKPNPGTAHQALEHAVGEKQKALADLREVLHR